MLLASAIPTIVTRELGFGSLMWVPIAQSALLIAIAIVLSRFAKLRTLSGFVLALAALRFGWYVAAPWIETHTAYHDWMRNASWGRRLFFARALLLVSSALTALTLIGSGIGRRDLFLRVGNLRAPAQPEPVLWYRRPIRWTRLGFAMLLLFGVALPLFLYFSVRPDFARIARVGEFLPWILATAVLNAANEEFQFRSVPLARLKTAISPREAVLLTGIFFGIGHYYGQPSGPIGVFMAAFAGWIWGKSMIETRGFTWAFSIHAVQDVVILSFLAMSVRGQTL
jgi:membrane protease YdiL (CAAX protease family)